MAPRGDAQNAAFAPKGKRDPQTTVQPAVFESKSSWGTGARLGFMVRKDISEIQEKGVALGGLRLVVLCLELGFIWLVYYAYGIAASHDMPL